MKFVPCVSKVEHAGESTPMCVLKIRYICVF